MLLCIADYNAGAHLARLKTVAILMFSVTVVVACTSERRPHGHPHLQASQIKLYAACLGVLVVPCRLWGRAQNPIYFVYQLRHGKEQQLHLDALPRAVRLFGELRGRTEGQTSFDLKRENDRAYELTRVQGGLDADLAPTVKVTLAFQDTHALGLPVPSVQPTMRDQFDLFTGNLDLHWKDQVHLVREDNR